MKPMIFPINFFSHRCHLLVPSKCHVQLSPSSLVGSTATYRFQSTLQIKGPQMRIRFRLLTFLSHNYVLKPNSTAQLSYEEDSYSIDEAKECPSVIVRFCNNFRNFNLINPTLNSIVRTCGERYAASKNYTATLSFSATLR